MMRQALLLSLVLTAVGCQQKYVIVPIEEDTGDITNLPDDGDDTDTTVDETTDTDDTTDETTDTGTEPDYSEWDGATLQILTPASGEFLPYGEDSAFEAVVYNAAGEPTDFSDIVWDSDIDDGWAQTASAFSDDSLDVGVHALTATAELPNGDRLVYTIGGLLVQSQYAGTYSGTAEIDGAYTEYAIGCSGPATIYIDAYGEESWGNASCLISLLGYDLDMVFDWEMELDGDTMEGSATVDFSGLFELPFDIDATINEDNVIDTEFDTDLGDLTVAGGMTLSQISRDVLED